MITHVSNKQTMRVFTKTGPNHRRGDYSMKAERSFFNDNAGFFTTIYWTATDAVSRLAICGSIDIPVNSGNPQ